MKSKSALATRIIILAAPIVALLSIPANAGSLVLQGSTTFTSTLIEHYGKAVEEQTGLQTEVVTNKSSLGLLALFEARADLAMLSAPLPIEIELLQAVRPDLPFERLKSFEIARVPAAFVVHRTNPIRTLPVTLIAKVLAGEITNWKELGGADLPIRVVAVRPGGGVLASVEAALLGKNHITAPDQVRVQVGTQVVKVVSQEPGAMGITQLSIVRESGAIQLETDHAVEQVLSLVTFGEPSDEARRFIQAMQHAAQEGP